MNYSPAQSKKIRAAEHRFCEAIDLKVDPDKYDGASCSACFIGQIIIADHLDKENGWHANEYGSFHDAGGYSVDNQHLVDAVAHKYGVDEEKVGKIFWGVSGECDCGFEEQDTWELEDGEEEMDDHTPECSYWFAKDFERARKEVVAAYMGC